MTADDALSSGVVLINRLEDASRSSRAGTNSPVNYSAALAGLREKLERLRGERGEVDEVCDRRERRWSLKIQLNQLKEDVHKVSVHIVHTYIRTYIQTLTSVNLYTLH